MVQETHVLDTLEGLVGILNEFRTGGVHHPSLHQLRSGRMHCTTCSREMTMSVSTMSSSYGMYEQNRVLTPRDLARALFTYECVECQSKWTVLTYPGPQGVSLAIFGQSLGGLSTPNTPEPVAYYLDQAYKAGGASANTAAVAMYRAALEHLLFQQGYTKSMLGTAVFFGSPGEQDPLVGPHQGGGRFTVSHEPIRWRLTDVPPFVDNRGGACGFQPGLKGLRWIADLDT
jgi:hypothetical protein